jgi:hypothetical protein
LKTAAQWRDELEAKLEARRPRIELWSDYYDGNHRLAFATSKFREAFGEMFEAFATNWCGLVVDTCAERLGIQGFRFGEDEADGEAWAIWQANGMDARSMAAHVEAIKAETAYLLISPPREQGGEPQITVETPFQVITEHDPADRRRIIAALKKYVDEHGNIVAVVYLPDQITTFVRDGQVERMEVLGIHLPISAGGEWRVQQVLQRHDHLVGVHVVPAARDDRRRPRVG